MKTIPLTQGKVAIVDDEDFERINAFKWYATKCPDGGGRFYALRNIELGGKRTHVKMHREVLRFGSKDPDLDHRDRDGLNNQKENLRVGNPRLNNMNKIGWSKTGFKGVHAIPNRRKPFQARIGIDGKQIHLGVFSTAIEAALAYNEKALELFGEFARLNAL